MGRVIPIKASYCKECAMTLLNEVFLRYGVPRRLISKHWDSICECGDAAVMFCLGYQSKSHSRISPTGKSVERKNRDLKPRLAMMVGNNHTLWTEKLPAIRFALNTSKCELTDHTAAYLTPSPENYELWTK
ncbi:transposon Tf2-6 polyprotein [Trichonephila clavipes]|nr:transposon Tf2-6 polyprotein [Trichonephila clavipes]